MKKLFSFVCALVYAMSLNAKTIYLSLGSIDWSKDGASFKEAVSGKSMTPVDGKSGYYQVAIEETQTTVTFQRIGSNGTDVWNKHENLTIPDGMDLYTLTGWDNQGNWSVYSAGGEGGGSTDPKDNFRQILRQNVYCEPEILFLSAKSFGKISINGDLLTSDAAAEIEKLILNCGNG